MDDDDIPIGSSAWLSKSMKTSDDEVDAGEPEGVPCRPESFRCVSVELASRLSEFEHCLEELWMNEERIRTLIATLPPEPAALDALWRAEGLLRYGRPREGVGRKKGRRYVRPDLADLVEARLNNVTGAWKQLVDYFQARATTPWETSVVAELTRKIPKSIFGYGGVREAWGVIEAVMRQPPGRIHGDRHGCSRVDGYKFELGLAYMSNGAGASYSVPLRLWRNEEVPYERKMSAAERAALNALIDRACALRAQGVDARAAQVNRWRILPAAIEDPAELEEHFRRQSGDAFESRWDASRIEQLVSLRPSRIAAGAGEFDGYYAFIFDGIDLTVLECAMTGNAVYLLDGNWRALSNKSKKELVGDGWGRIVHRGEWFERLSAEVAARRQRSAKPETGGERH